MKVVKIKGKSDIEPLGVCMCDATLAEVASADPECVCMCDMAQCDDESKLDLKYVQAP